MAFFFFRIPHKPMESFGFAWWWTVIRVKISSSGSSLPRFKYDLGPGKLFRTGATFLTFSCRCRLASPRCRGRRRPSRCSRGTAGRSTSTGSRCTPRSAGYKKVRIKDLQIHPLDKTRQLNNLRFKGQVVMGARGPGW